MAATPKLSFASDNTASAHPRILKALAEANSGWARAYGDDPWTEKLQARVRAEFGAEARAYPVFNGTGANITAIASLLKPWQAVIAADSSHLQVDECAGMERFAGCKVVTVPAHEGKLRVADLEPLLQGRGDVHRVQPRVISISQSTEHGTVYSADELAEISRFARKNGLLLHVDGARFANAAAALGLSLGDASGALGVDALSFGGTKNGLLYGELVVLFGRPDEGEYPFARKQGMQLASKQRYLAAQFLAYLEDGLWRENALHANAMARKLEQALQGHVPIAYPVQANAVFPILTDAVFEKLQKDFYFYRWDAARGIARVMMSFETRTEDVELFAERLKAAL